MASPDKKEPFLGPILPEVDLQISLKIHIGDPRRGMKNFFSNVSNWFEVSRASYLVSIRSPSLANSRQPNLFEKVPSSSERIFPFSIFYSSASPEIK